jgi:plasmid stabilization system protein ParE
VRFSIEVTPHAERDLTAAAAFIATDSPEAAIDWLESVDAVFAGLSQYPARYALAPEATKLGVELRQAVLGEYRILFRTRGRRVQIIHVRHGKRRRASRSELGPDLQ